MKKIRDLCVTLVVMFLISLISLLVVTLLSYNYKWQADKAMVGITVTYILVGFSGGLVQRFLDKKERSIGQKMLGGILLASFFIGILCVVSFVLGSGSMQISSRFLMIWMLLIGSTCLGRIL